MERRISNSRIRWERDGLGKRNRYIDGIDGLRAIAVLMVLAYHLKLPFAKGGLLGVTVFFVISGLGEFGGYCQRF